MKESAGKKIRSGSGKKIGNVRDYPTSPSTRASCISDSPEITSTTIARRRLASRELRWGPMILVLLTTMSSRISVSGSTMPLPACASRMT